MNSNFRSDILPIAAITFIVFCGVAVALSLRAQERDNSRYTKLTNVTTLQREERQFDRGMNITMEGNCVVFIKKDMLELEAPILFQSKSFKMRFS